MRWTLVVILVVETVRYVAGDGDGEPPLYGEWQELPGDREQGRNLHFATCSIGEKSTMQKSRVHKGNQEYHEIEQETTTDFVNPWTLGVDSRVIEDDDEDLDEELKPEWEAEEFRTTKAPRTRRTFNWTHRTNNWTTRPRTTRKMFTGVTFNSSHVLCTEEPYTLFDPVDVTNYIVVDKSNHYDRFIAYRQKQIEKFRQQMAEIEKKIDSLDTVEKCLPKGEFDLNSENNLTQRLSIDLHEHKLRQEIRTYESIVKNFQNQIDVCRQLTDLDTQKDKLKRELATKEAVYARKSTTLEMSNVTCASEDCVTDVSDEYTRANESYHAVLIDRRPLIRSLNESNREYSKLLSEMETIKHQVYSKDDYEHVLFNINHLVDRLDLSFANNKINSEVLHTRKEILRNLAEILQFKIIAAHHLENVKDAKFRTNYWKRTVKTNVTLDKYMYERHQNRTLESLGRTLRDLFQVKSLEYEYDSGNCTHDYCEADGIYNTECKNNLSSPSIITPSTNNLLQKADNSIEPKNQSQPLNDIRRKFDNHNTSENVPMKTNMLSSDDDQPHRGIHRTESLFKARNQTIHRDELHLLPITEADENDNDVFGNENSSKESKLRKIKDQDYNEVLAEKYIDELRHLESYVDAVHDKVNKTHERFNQLWDTLGSSIFLADIADKYNHQNLVKIFGIPGNFSLLMGSDSGRNITELTILQNIGKVLNKKLSLKKIKTAYQDWNSDYQRPPIIAEFKKYRDKLRYIKDYMNFILIKPRQPNERPVFTKLKLKPRVVYLPWQVYRSYPLKYKYDRFIIRDDLPDRMNDLILRVKRKINETGMSDSSIVWHNNSRVFFRRHYHGHIRRVHYFDNLDKLFEESDENTYKREEDELPSYLQKRTTSFGKRWFLMKQKRKFFLRPTKKRTTRYMFWVITKSTTTRMTDTIIDKKLLAKKYKVW